MITAGLLCVFAALWFALPLSRRGRDDIDDHEDPVQGR